MSDRIQSQELIYCHAVRTNTGTFLKWVILIFKLLLSMANGLLVAMALLMISSLFVKFPIWVFIVFWIPSSVLVFYWILKSDRASKPSYKIYDDRIEFFNEKYPLEKDVIDLAEIDQARYEDDFGKSISSQVPDSYFIYCYFKNDYKSKSKKIKNDRLKLVLKKGENKENDIIQILQFFQKKKKQVYISTKHKEINTALNLKNWTEPDVHLPFRL